VNGGGEEVVEMNIVVRHALGGLACIGYASMLNQSVVLCVRFGINSANDFSFSAYSTRSFAKVWDRPMI